MKDFSTWKSLPLNSFSLPVSLGSAALIATTLFGTMGCGEPPPPVSMSESVPMVVDREQGTNFDDSRLHPFSERLETEFFRAGSSAYVDLGGPTVTSHYGREASAVAAASSDDESVLQVEIIEADEGESTRLRLDFVAAGTANLIVEYETPNGELRDGEAQFQVLAADNMLAKHSCESDSSHGVYLTGSDIQIGYAYFNEAAPLPLFGFGGHGISVEGDAELTYDESNEDLLYMPFRLGDSAGEATIDLAAAAAPLTLEIVDPGAIDGAALLWQEELESAEMGRPGEGYVVPTVEGKQVCYADVAYDAETLTPDICSVMATDGIADFDAYPGAAPLAVRQNEPGTCEVQVTYAVGNDGDDAVEIFELWGEDEGE